MFKDNTGRVLSIIFLISSLFGCFGGSGDNSLKTLEYSGNTNSAVITQENAVILVANVLYSGKVSSILPTSDNAIRSGGVIAQSKILGGISRIIGDAISGIELNKQIACDSGSGNVNGSLSDTTDTGIFTFTFSDCMIGENIYNGTGSYIIDEDYAKATDVSIIFSLMTIRSVEFTGSVSGTVRHQIAIIPTISTTVEMTLDYISKDDLTGKVYKYENILITSEIDEFNYTPFISCTGTPAQLYDSIHGYVEIDTFKELTFSSSSLDYPDIDGVIVLTGSSGSSIKVTVLSGEHFQLEFDLDGLSGYEELQTMFWNELAVNVDTDLTTDEPAI